MARDQAHVASEPVAMRPFSESLPMALLRAREAAMCRFRPLLADHDLTEQQWRVLRALAASPRPLLIGEIAERTFLLGPSLSRILTKLERRHLVTRRRSRNDLRASTVTLSSRGWAIVAEVAPQSEAVYATIEEAFGHARLERLLAELHDLAAIDPPTPEGPT